MELVERMRRGISVTPVDGIPWDFRIQFEYGEPGAAQRVTQDLTSGFLRAANTAHNLEVLAISVLPQTPAGLPRAAITTTGLALGLGLGAIVAALLKRRFAQGPAAS
jgi:hypothetical protein